MDNQVKAIVLAGGSGTRLWPLSRQQLPKQFLHLHANASLLDATIARLAPLISVEDVWVVTNEAHASGEAYTALSELHKILEPVGRNTAPAIALAAALMMDLEQADPVLVVLPADHLIQDIPAFHVSLNLAIAEAKAGALVTFGITPTHADTGFGYIQVAHAMEQGLAAHGVKRFAEKPDAKTAAGFLVSGDYYWNSGMFVWKASTILAEVERYLPDVAAVLDGMRSRWQAGEAWQEVVRHGFEAMPSISIDYGVMEQSEKVRLVPCDMGWSDVGSWDAVYDVSEKDVHGNALSGDVLAFNCENSLLRSESRLVAAVGLEDVIAVETPDAVLLCKRGDSQGIRDVVDALKARGSSEHVLHRTVQRPWGSYTVLDDRATGYKMKRIDVKPGASLSLQSHQHRSEHWVVVAGTATVTRNDAVIMVAKNESTYIPIGVKHRLENRGKVPLKIVEIQVGEYLEEDDIERFDDVYGRSNA